MHSLSMGAFLSSATNIAAILNCSHFSVLINSNQCGEWGGAVYFRGRFLTINNSVFEDNWTGVDGGAVRGFEVLEARIVSTQFWG